MGFSGPPSEPDVRLSPHPALHVLMPLESLTRASGSARPGNDIARWRYRPLVQLRLHREPATRPRSGWATKRRFSPATPSPCFGAANTLDPFAMYTAFPCSDYYGSSAPLRRRRPATGLPRMMAGIDEVVPTFALEPFNGVGAQLCPCNFAISMPQTRRGCAAVRTPRGWRSRSP